MKDDSPPAGQARPTAESVSTDRHHRFLPFPTPGTFQGMPLGPGLSTPTQGLDCGDQHQLSLMLASFLSSSALMRLWISCVLATMGSLLQQLHHWYLERFGEFGHCAQGRVLHPLLQPSKVLSGNPCLFSQGGLGEALIPAEGFKPGDEGVLGILHGDL